MKINKLMLAGAMLFAGASALAQETVTEYSYTPNWYIQGQFGGQETLGESSFGHLFSPNAQIAGGYNFNPYIGARLAVNAWQSKGVLNLPSPLANQRWKWNYVAPTVDAVVNMTNLIGGYNPNRLVDVDLIAGIGANIGFSNNEANTTNQYLINNHAGALEYIWDGTKARFLGQFGLDVNFNVSEHVAVGLEFMANVLPDGYNSKKAGNADWYFNGLVGVKYTFGPSFSKRKKEVPAPQVIVEEKIVEKIVEVPAKPVEVVKDVQEPITRDIFFTISKTQISLYEMQKVKEIAEYLKANPKAKVSITGYADKGTGSLKLNTSIY